MHWRGGATDVAAGAGAAALIGGCPSGAVRVHCCRAGDATRTGGRESGGVWSAVWARRCFSESGAPRGRCFPPPARSCAVAWIMDMHAGRVLEVRSLGKRSAPRRASTQLSKVGRRYAHREIGIVLRRLARSMVRQLRSWEKFAQSLTRLVAIAPTLARRRL